MFKPGDRVLHEYNRELGPGVVEAVEGGRMRVHFPRSGDTLVFSLKEPAFRRMMKSLDGRKRIGSRTLPRRARKPAGKIE